MRPLALLKFLFRIRGKPTPLLPPPGSEIANAEPVAVVAAEHSAAPESDSVEQIVEALAEPAAIDTSVIELPASLPAPLPHTPSRAAAADDEMRARVLYFTPAAYSRSAGVQRVLAPDLLFHLGTEAHRALAEAPGNRPAPAPAIPRTPPRREQRLLIDFATSQETEARPDPTGRVLDIDPLLFSLFLATREAGPDVPPEATSEYLTWPPLLALGAELRDRVLRHWSSGGPPLRAEQLYNLARQVTAHAGTAFLLCHNVTKAFARGGAAIAWQVTNRARGEYTDGKSTWTAAALHREGVLKTGPFANPSIFYVLFSSAGFGTADTGDYYRCFAAAAAAWYAASGQTRVPVEPSSPAAAQQARLLEDIAKQMTAEPDPTPARRAWLWMNAASFLEAAVFSRSQPAARAAALVSLRGTVFGLREADRLTEPEWRWYVPVAGNGLGPPLDIARVSAELLAPDAVSPIPR